MVPLALASKLQNLGSTPASSSLRLKSEGPIAKDKSSSPPALEGRREEMA